MNIYFGKLCNFSPNAPILSPLEGIHFSTNRCWIWQCKLLWPIVCKWDNTFHIYVNYLNSLHGLPFSWASPLYHKKKTFHVSLPQHPEFWIEKKRGSESNSTHIWIRSTTANLQVYVWKINDGNCKQLKIGL